LADQPLWKAALEQATAGKSRQLKLSAYRASKRQKKRKKPPANDPPLKRRRKKPKAVSPKTPTRKAAVPAPHARPVCEYRRCEGLGRREIKLRWTARTYVVMGNRRWHVCEHCADLLKRDHGKALRAAQQE